MSRSTTPSYRSSLAPELRSAQTYPVDPECTPLESSTLLPLLSALADKMSSFASDMDYLANVETPLVQRLNSSLGAFLYSLNITTWCTDVPGVPSKEEWDRIRKLHMVDERIRELEAQVEFQAQESRELAALLREKTERNTVLAIPRRLLPGARRSGMIPGSKLYRIRKPKS